MHASPVAVAVAPRFRILQDAANYAASALGSQAISLVAGFWVARLLGPSDFGIWNAASLVLVYGAYVADGGALSAMGRDVPYHHGRGDAGTAASVDAAARYVTIAGAALASLVVVAISILYVDSPALAMAMQVMAVVLFLQQVYTYHRTFLRTNNQFGELSGQQLLLSIGTAVLSVAGVAALGLAGRLAAAVTAQVGIVTYAIRRHRWSQLPPPARSVIWSAIRAGIPITLSGSIITLVTTVDRVMVISFLGETQLGYFGLAVLLTSIISLVPAMAGQVLHPRVSHQYGRSGGDLEALRPFILTPPVVLACLLPVVIGPVYIVLPAVIAYLLPEYVPAIAATRIVVLGIFFLSVLGLTDYFLVLTGRLRQYVLLGCITLAANVALDFAAIRMGYGIEGVALAGTPLTYWFHSSLLIGYVLSHYSRRASDWLAYFGRLWWPFAYMVGILWLIERVVGSVIPASTAAAAAQTAGLQVVLYLLGTVPLLMHAARELKIELSPTGLARVWSAYP